MPSPEEINKLIHTLNATTDISMQWNNELVTFAGFGVVNCLKQNITKVIHRFIPGEFEGSDVENNSIVLFKIVTFNLRKIGDGYDWYLY